MAIRSELEAGSVGGPPPTSESDASSRRFHHRSDAPTIVWTPPALDRYAFPRIALGLLTLVLVAAAFVAGASQSATAGTPARASAVIAIAAIEPTGSDTSLACTVASGISRRMASHR